MASNIPDDLPPGATPVGISTGPSKAPDDLPPGAKPVGVSGSAKPYTDEVSIPLASHAPGQPLAPKVAPPQSPPGTIENILTRSGMFSPETAKAKLGRDFFAFLEGSAGIAPVTGFTGIGRNMALKEATKVPSAAQTLMAEGVKLTPGQIAGGMTQSLENKATHLPFMGDQITSARKNALATWNTATGNRVLAPLGMKVEEDVKPGVDLVSHVGDKVSQAYKDAHKGLEFTVDPEYVASATGTLKKYAERLKPEDAEQLRGIVKSIVDSRLFSVEKKEIPAEWDLFGTSVVKEAKSVSERVPKEVSGKDLQTIRSELRSEARAFRNSRNPGDNSIGRALEDIDFDLGESLARTNPESAEALQKADTAYAMLVRMEEAAAKRVASGGVFTPGDFLSAVKQTETGVRNKAFSRGDALLQRWGQEAQTVLPGSADSGTAGRNAVNMLTGIGGYALDPHTLVGLGAGMIPYTAPGISAINKVARSGRPTLGATAPYIPAAVGSLEGGQPTNIADSIRALRKGSK